MILIIDYEIGNVHSIFNMISRIGVDARISRDIFAINDANGLILPGVGSFDQGVKNLQRLKLWDALNEQVLHKKCPILGICLGMQLLTKSSEEGVLHGLGWVDATTRRFRFDVQPLTPKIPHMGWNKVLPVQDAGLFAGYDAPPRFYFVHSYHVACTNDQDVLATSNYGYEFVSAIRKDNVFGVQFHPEKSHKYGLKLLSNFIRMLS